MTDPIADMLTRIRNAVRAKHPRVEMPHSKTKAAIAAVLQAEGYINGASEVEKGKFKVLRVALRYDGEGRPLISGIQMVSKPGRRVYTAHDEIPRVLGGIGTSIVSTPKGILSGREARKAGVGGEIICNIF